MDVSRVGVQKSRFFARLLGTHAWRQLCIYCAKTMVWGVSSPSSSSHEISITPPPESPARRDVDGRCTQEITPSPVRYFQQGNITDRQYTVSSPVCLQRNMQQRDITERVSPRAKPRPREDCSTEKASVMLTFWMSRAKGLTDGWDILSMWRRSSLSTYNSEGAQEDCTQMRRSMLPLISCPSSTWICWCH